MNNYDELLRVSDGISSFLRVGALFKSALLFYTMITLRRVSSSIRIYTRDAILQNTFAIVALEITIFDGARWCDPLPKVGAWCRRDVIFSKKQTFDMD